MVNWAEVRDAALPILGGLGLTLGLIVIGAFMGLFARCIHEGIPQQIFQDCKFALHTLEVRMTEQSQAQLVCEECGGDYSPYGSTAKNVRGFCSTECEVSGLTPPAPRPPQPVQNPYYDNGAYMQMMAQAQNARLQVAQYNMRPATYTTGIVDFPAPYPVYNNEGLLLYTIQGDGTTTNAANPRN